MRIVHAISTLNPSHGGPPNVCGALSAAQAGLGHQVSIIAYDDPESSQYLPEVYGPLPGWSEVTLKLVPIPNRLERVSGIAAGLCAESILREAEFLHIHSVWEPILVRAASVARRMTVPYCVLLNGMLDPWALAQSRLKKQLSLALFQHKMLSEAAFLHTLNEDEERLLAPLELRTPLVRLPNGIFPSDVDPLPLAGSFRARTPQLEDKPFILFLGRLHHKKGTDLLAAAFKRLAPILPDVQLAVVGPDDGALESFIDTIAEAQLSHRVHVLGPLYGHDKFPAMVDAACLCLPSRQEGFSLVLIEALACGCPVVISENCHFPEVSQMSAGKVVPLDPDRIADALVSILENPAEAKSMGSAGREFVLSHLTWPNIAERTICAYERYRRLAPG